MNARTARYLLFFVGIGLLLAALPVGLAGINYEFELRATHDEAPLNGGGSFANYESLEPRGQRMVRGAIDGRRYVVDRQGKLPRNGIGKLTVEYRSRYYTLSRRPFLNLNTWPGRAAVGLALLGLSSTAVAVRRDVRARR